MIKSPGEIKRIRRAWDITCRGIEVAFRSIREGTTEHELLNILVAEWLRLGADTATPR
jgi:Xaa-Pro aminopeptidase